MHPNWPIALSASDDQSVRLWNLAGRPATPSAESGAGDAAPRAVPPAEPVNHEGANEKNNRGRPSQCGDCRRRHVGGFGSEAGHHVENFEQFDGDSTRGSFLNGLSLGNVAAGRDRAGWVALHRSSETEKELGAFSKYHQCRTSLSHYRGS